MPVHGNFTYFSHFQGIQISSNCLHNGKILLYAGGSQMVVGIFTKKSIIKALFFSVVHEKQLNSWSLDFDIRKKIVRKKSQIQKIELKCISIPFSKWKCFFYLWCTNVEFLTTIIGLSNVGFIFQFQRSNSGRWLQKKKVEKVKKEKTIHSSHVL